jgi:hypothetical protein
VHVIKKERKGKKTRNYNHAKISGLKAETVEDLPETEIRIRLHVIRFLDFSLTFLAMPITESCGCAGEGDRRGPCLSEPLLRGRGWRLLCQLSWTSAFIHFHVIL